MSQYFWAVSLDKVSLVNSNNNEITKSKRVRKNTKAVIDSGSSYLLMPEGYFWDFFIELTKTEDTYCEVDYYNTLYCTYTEDSYHKLPELDFEIDGKSYRVPRKSLYVPLDEYEGLLAVEVTYIEGWNEWLFGLTFLENYYAVYDMEK